MDSKKLADSFDGTNDNSGQHFVQSNFFLRKFISMENVITMNYCSLVQMNLYLSSNSIPASYGKMSRGIAQGSVKQGYSLLALGWVIIQCRHNSIEI